MINWFFDKLRRWLGHYLLSDEELEKIAADNARRDKQDEIINSNITTEETADTLDRGEF